MSESLATKYRPKTFNEVIGQERSIQILQNQIEKNTLRQGYLFCGSAGTGKTTLARILANTINADIVEIDAASNNGVDNIRDLRESVKFKPFGHEKRVYIIDEVHMLSTGAFNALLKVLEEPPEHIIFILCTTDPQKIPATIISRVQRYDFKRVETEKVVERLRYIMFMELGLTNDSDDQRAALEYIAKVTGGGVRDAISLLDTCLGYSNELTEQSVLEVIGAVGIDINIDIWEGVTSHDAQKVISAVNTLFVNGKDLKLFMRNFIEFVVDLQILSITKDISLVNIPLSVKERIDTLELSQKKFDIVIPKLFKLNNEIKYDSKPKNLIIGGLVTMLRGD